jgi:hypothetical protein
MNSKVLTFFIIIGLGLCTQCKKEKMNDNNTQIIVKNDNGDIVGEIGVRDNKIHGLCIWYSGDQNPIACGLFNEGKPYTGTFANWSKFIENWDGGTYQTDLYCQDWVTMFELRSISQATNFNEIIESYSKGQLIQ